jgi:hypothetical protein
MRRIVATRQLFVPLFSLATGIALGIAVQRYGLVGKMKELLLVPPQRSRSASRPDPAKRCLTLLCLGQSNAANFGDVRSSGGSGTFAFCQGKYFACDDPMPGAGGDGGSVWSRVASRVLFETGIDCCIVCDLAQGSTSIADWAPDGTLFNRAVSSAIQLQKDGFPISAVVWHQGETDAELQTTTSQYHERLKQMIQRFRDFGIDAPIFVCIASRGSNGRTFEPVRLAQQSVVDAGQRIYPGCDTDALDEHARWDRLHFNLRGLDAFARDLVNRFVASGLIPRGKSVSGKADQTQSIGTAR